LTISITGAKARDEITSVPNMEILLFVLLMVLLAAFAVTSQEVGVDSRDGFDDPHRSDYPVGIA
jgi:hypothetical protein